jgi:hypothetical protein
MLKNAEKPDFTNVRAIRVWTEAWISSGMRPANQIVCINSQENCLKKEKS